MTIDQATFDEAVLASADHYKLMMIDTCNYSQAYDYVHQRYDTFEPIFNPTAYIRQADSMHLAQRRLKAVAEFQKAVREIEATEKGRTDGRH